MSRPSSLLRSLYDFSMANDPWATSMSAFFDVAGEMWNRSCSIPWEWKFSPGMGTPQIEDDYTRKEIEKLTDDQLLAFGRFLSRLTDILERLGHSY